MEAPDRIYIHPTLDNLYGMCERSCDSEIEYVRKDIFTKQTWTHEELDIIEMIIYDVQMRKAYYEDNNAPTCVKECEQELEFLEKLKSIDIYDTRRN